MTTRGSGWIQRTETPYTAFDTVGSLASDWFVSHSGDDTDSCGRSKAEPCKTIPVVIKKSQEGDTIFLDGTTSPKLPAQHYGNLTSIIVDKGLSFISYGSHGDHASIESGYFLVTCSNRSQNVTFKGLSFKNTEVTVQRCLVCTLQDSVFQASQWIEKALHLHFDAHTRMRVVIDHCRFTNNQHLVFGCVSIEGNNLDITVEHTTFENNAFEDPLQKSILWVVPVDNDHPSHLQLSLTEVTFLHNKGRAVWVSPVFEQELRNEFALDDEYNGAVQNPDPDRCVVEVFLNSCTFKGNTGGGFFVEAQNNNKSRVMVTNTQLANNVNFSFFVQKCNDVSLHGVTFKANDCLTGAKNGPLFHISTEHPLDLVNISRNRFYQNTCDLSVIKITSTKQPDLTNYVGEGCGDQTNTTSYSLEKFPAMVYITDSEFVNNSGMSQTTLSLENGYVTLRNNTFTDSFSYVTGSHITVSEGFPTVVYIINTLFRQTVPNRKIWNKNVPFSGMMSAGNSGQLHIQDGTSFRVEFFGNVDPLIIVQGANQVSMDRNSTIKCSRGSLLYFNNFTHCELMGSTFQYMRITTFTLVCSTCPTGSYSIHNGYSTGLQVNSNFQCQPCPFGAECTNNLAARQNFWGYPVGDKVNFINCPPGYCCPGNQSCHYRNDTYKTAGCQGHRTGTLCGKCLDNFTEALFSSHCRPARECNDWWYWILALLVIVGFAWYLVRKPPILQDILKNMFWFSGRVQKSLSHEGPTSNSGKQQFGFLKILFYFYQIAGLLTVPSNGTSHVIMDYMIQPFVGLFTLTFHDSTGFAVCPYNSLTQTLKAALPLVGVATLHLSVLAIYFIDLLMNKLSKSTTVFPPSDGYLAASMECLLLSYSTLAYTLLKLLSWVHIEGRYQWYYDANISLDFSHWWQVASLVCTITQVVPFIFVLYLGAQKLYRGQISAGRFIVACYVPLPFLIYWILECCCTSRRGSSSQELVPTSTLGSASEEWSSTDTSDDHSSVVEVLSAPFRKPDNPKSLGTIHWESVLIGRRFVLIAAALFLPQHYFISVCLTMLCLFILVHHVMQQPFRNHYANVIETLSLASLVIIATINIAVVVFSSSGIEVPSSYKWFIEVFLYIEAALLGAVPVLFALILVVSGLSQMVRVLLFIRRLICCEAPSREDVARDHLISDVSVEDDFNPHAWVCLTLSLPRVINNSNYPCSITRNIT